MTSELVDLTGYLNIKKPLLTWLRIFSQDDDNKELNNLNDGIFLNKVWCEINDLKEEDRTSNKSSDDNLSDTNQITKPKINKKSERIKNLNNLIVNLKQFYEQVLGQFLVLKLPDIFRIAYSTDNELVNNDLNTLILLLLGSAVQCDKKEYFIEKIKELNLDDQHELVDCIQQITDNPISVWSINEWSDLNLLPQSEHEKMYNLLFLHIQSLIQERDLLFERLVTIVIKLENLNEQKCDCSKSTKELNDEMLNILNFSTINRLDNQLNNLSIINNNINLTNLTINQSFHHSTPSKSPFHKLEKSLNNSIFNKNCPNCRSLLNESISSTNKLDKKTEIDDSSLQSLQSLSSLTKEDDSELNLKLKQTIEELNEFKHKLRTVQTAQEEKTEMIAELKELLEQSKETCCKLREENLELIQEARSSKAYRDEVDILNEKVRTFHHLENELQKYKLKMNEFDFYKARVDELRDENRLLSDAKQMLEEQLELSRKKSENFNEIESQLYQLKAYSSELKTQRELDKDKIQNLIEKIAELQVEKKSTIEELSVCQSELKHLRSQLNNSQIYLNDYNNKLNNQGTNNNNNDNKLLNHNNSNNESIEPNSEETSLELMINTNLENEKNLRSSLLEQLNSDASKRILKLELENQKLKFIIENNLRTNDNKIDNTNDNMNDNKNKLNNDRRKHSSSISSLGSVHSDESKEDDQLNNNNNNNNLNNNKSNQLTTDRLGDRCSSNSSTDSIKSTSLSVFSNTTNSNQLNTNQFNSPSTSPLDNNEYDSGCVSLVCENNHNIKSNSITPINMLRMQQQQQQLDKERLEEEEEQEEEILSCNKTSPIGNQLTNNQLQKTINCNNSTIKQKSLNKFTNQQLNDTQLNQHLNHSNNKSTNNNLLTTDINSNNTVKSNNHLNQHLQSNYRSTSESSNCDDEHQLNRLRLFNGSSSSLSSNASSNIGLKQQQQLIKCNQTDLNKLNNSITLNATGNTIKNRTTTDQIKQIDVKRMPLMSTSQIESELEAESYLPVNYTTIQLKDNLKIKSPKYQIKNNQLIDTPPRLPPRNPISSTTSSCSSPSNSPLTIHTNNKQLINGKLILDKNETIQSNKSTMENKYAFNFLTKSSCTVNNSLINSNSNTCTIRQTTSTYNNPTTITVLNGSNLNGPSTGFSSSSIITTTTTTQCLNQPQQRKITNTELITNEQSKDLKNLYNQNSSPNNNFVRGVFRSCNVNFGPNFKSQKFVTNTKTATPVTTLNNSLNTTGLAKINRLNGISEINRTSLRAESLNNKTNKLINKAIQQNGYILTKQLTNQPSTTKNDHKINDITTTSNNFNYLTNSVSSPSLNSSESDDDEYEETDLQRLNTTTKTNIKQINKSSPNKLNNSSNHHLHNSNNLKSSMQIYQSPLQRSKTLMLNSNGKPENHNTNRPQRIEITTTHHHPNQNCQENRSLVSSPVSTVSSKSVWYEYGCV